MNIIKLNLDSFMLFSRLKLEFSSGINVICGANSTGKTVLLKTMYAILQAYHKSPADITKKEMEVEFASKFQGVFRPDQNNIGRLVSHKRGSNRAEIQMELAGNRQIAVDFTNRSSRRVNVSFANLSASEKDQVQPVYLPPKEIISATENFTSLYEDYRIAFDETYYDLARLLNRPLKKGINTAEQNQVIEQFESIMSGKVVQKDKKFFLYVQGSGEFEMGLVSEGFRKLATILCLIASGSLTKNSILFWDELETNMSPGMIRPIVEAVIELAKIGVQVFISTHDYFVQQEFAVAAHSSANPSKVDIRFIHLGEKIPSFQPKMNRL